MARSRRASTMSLAADMMLAPMVIGMRMPVLLAESGSSTGLPGAESMKAFTEKTTAMAQGVLAAQLSLIGSASRFWPEVLSGKTPSMLNGVAAEHAMHAALRPAGRAVKANFRRLSAGKRG